MRRWVFLSALIGLTLTSPLAADPIDPMDPIEPDRPDFSEGTGIIPAGHVQVEGGATFARVDDNETTSLGEILVRIPLAEWLEARLNIGSYDWSRERGGGGPSSRGYEDPEVGVKVHVADSSGGFPDVALLFLTTVPVGSRDFTADAWQPTVKLAVGWDLTPRFSLSSNLNVAYLAEGDDRFAQTAASLSAGYSLSDRLGAFLEAFGFSEETSGGPATAYINGGFAYAVSDDLSLDVRAGTGLNDASPDYFLGAGASVRW
jgi:hypothetical protein